MRAARLRRLVLIAGLGLNDGGQRCGQVGMRELVVEFLEFVWLDALAGEEQGVSQFAEEEAEGEGGRGEERGAVQGGG